MEALSRDEFDIVAAHLTPAPLAACMMVSKRVRALTKPHYNPDFIADYELQQSKWSRTAFTSDVRGVLKQTWERKQAKKLSLVFKLERPSPVSRETGAAESSF